MIVGIIKFYDECSKLEHESFQFNYSIWNIFFFFLAWITRMNFVSGYY